MNPDVFLACRPRLLGVAYGILGELAEAEDVVQDTWLRWQAAERHEVRSAEAFLVTTTTRLAIDQRRSARARRESYVGTWLPDPLVRDPADPDDPETRAIEAEQLSLALLGALERLNPVERAVLVLRDVFDVDYAEIADAVDISPANARQLAKRARERADDTTRRRPVDQREQQRLTTAFLLAAQHGDVEQMLAVLAADAIQYSDGGGKVTVARTPIHGANRISRFYANVRRSGHFPLDLTASAVLVNGDPGVRLVSASTGPYSITALEIVDGRVQAIRNFANPERFGHLQP
ncbi:MAG TPA: RNA polymerase sigma factor SigJ [Conexibacter sp.]|nr:RNA polymerase sigma factor SigJ [Conexibacter sp.]